MPSLSDELDSKSPGMESDQGDSLFSLIHKYTQLGDKLWETKTVMIYDGCYQHFAPIVLREKSLQMISRKYPMMAMGIVQYDIVPILTVGDSWNGLMSKKMMLLNLQSSESKGTLKADFWFSGFSSKLPQLREYFFWGNLRKVLIFQVQF